MLVLTGVTPEEGKENPHIIVSDDGKAAVWVGVIDDRILRRKFVKSSHTREHIAFRCHFPTNTQYTLVSQFFI